MSWLPKIIALCSLWAVVGVVIFTIEPVLVRDIWLPGLYLPLMGVIFLATLYTWLLILRRFTRAILSTLLIVFTLELSIHGFMYWYIALSLFSTLVLIVTFPHRKDLTEHSVS